MFIIWRAALTFRWRTGKEKEIGNQGQKNKLRKESDGWDTLESVDEVEAHYTRTLLDRTQFD